ncbi:hypothetical protein [Citricoccus sp. GCM10030269]|uniref:hypothetical protein n=1 Tax=Citricoccus sp. GCM10030269 TaxID=3273388 RepID=UPI0036121864
MREEEDFDVEAVPAFPVLTLWMDEASERTELNGVPIEAAPGGDYREAAIDAVVRDVQKRALEAVRVRVLTPTGEAWDMVVTADGDVYDTTVTEAPATTKSARIRRPLVIGAVALCAVSFLGVGTAIGLSALGEDTEEQWVVPGADRQIPIALPSPFALRSAWSVPVDEDSDVAALDTGHILSTAPGGTLTARNPETGQVAWRGNDAPDDLAATVHTDWAGQPSLVSLSGNQLRVWDLRTPQDGTTVTSTTITLEQDWRAEIRGERPFVDLGDWIVGVPQTGHRLRHVVIPAGTRAVTVTGQNQIITASDATLYTVNDDGIVAGRASYSAPAGTAGAPDRSWMLDNDHALLAWDSEAGETMMSIINVKDGTTRATAEVSRAPDQQERPIVDEQGRAAAFDSVSLSWGPDPVLRPLESFETSTIHNATAYGLAGRENPAGLDLASLKSRPEPWDTFAEDDPAPDLITGDGAYVVADTLDTTVLYRAEKTNPEER